SAVNSAIDFERRVSAWLETGAPVREPDGLADHVLADTSRLRPRPSWTNLEWWIPMHKRARFGAVPWGVVFVATVATLTLVVGVAIALASGPTTVTPVTPTIPPGPTPAASRSASRHQYLGVFELSSSPPMNRFEQDTFGVH